MPGIGSRADFLLGDKKSLSCDLILKRVVFRRIDAVDAARQNRDCGEVQCAGVCRRVDAAGKSRYDGETGFSQLRRERTRKSNTGTGSIAGTDHRHSGTAEQFRVTHNRDQGRRVWQCGEGFGGTGPRRV